MFSFLTISPFQPHGRCHGSVTRPCKQVSWSKLPLEIRQKILHHFLHVALICDPRYIIDFSTALARILKAFEPDELSFPITTFMQDLDRDISMARERYLELRARWFATEAEARNPRALFEQQKLEEEADQMSVFLRSHLGEYERLWACRGEVICCLNALMEKKVSLTVFAKVFVLTTCLDIRCGHQKDPALPRSKSLFWHHTALDSTTGELKAEEEV